MSYKELVLGSGYSDTIKKQLFLDDKQSFENLVTLDINPDANPTVVWDLNNLPLPFDDEEFDEIHAYDVLEHIGRQGDVTRFFEEFGEYWRILKPDGLLFATVPSGMKAAFSDPGHTRVINEITILFLSQEEYKDQVGRTKMTDYRNVWKKDFQVVAVRRNDYEHNLSFILRKVDVPDL
jgi:SAM-dependent methyltransferase